MTRSDLAIGPKTLPKDRTLNLLVAPAVKGMAEHAEQVCGVPCPDRPDRFGNFDFMPHGHSFGIWEFDGVSRKWARCRLFGGDLYERPIAFAPGASEAERDIITTVMHLGVVLDPPSPPEDLSVVTTADPLRWWDWRIAWRFFPDLRRWEMVLLGPV